MWPPLSGQLLPLLQGIRAADRSRLLALCLAALEAQVSALPAAGGLLTGTTAQWRQLCSSLLALASVAAAAAWLGYVPEQLLGAAAARLRAAEPAVLQAAGLLPAAATVQQRAADVSAARRSAGEEPGGGEEGEGAAIEWFCLAEKLQLYSSVLRLLSCDSIEQQQQPGAPGGRVYGQPAAAAAAPADGSVQSSAAAPQAHGLLASGAAPGALTRSQALQVLQQEGPQQDTALGGIRGWRATAAGARSGSQLLALAPTVLQDMAVTAADAVAAAYLADAATAGPTLAVAGSGAGQAAAAAPSQQQQEQEGQARGRWRRLQGPRRAVAVPAQQPGGGTGGGAGGSASGSTPLESGWWPTYVHSQLARSRQLQRFTNQVSVNRWVQVKGGRLGAWAGGLTWRARLGCLLRST